MISTFALHLNYHLHHGKSAQCSSWTPLTSQPPKKSQISITIIKFKRSRSTYSIPLALDVKKNLTLKYFTNAVVHAINSSGGLRLVDNEDPADQVDIQEGLQVTSGDIQLALPKNKENPYDNVWFPVDDDLSLQTVVFNDYDLIAFKFEDDQDFHIEQLEYVEPN